jgi:hypothetical protein
MAALCLVVCHLVDKYVTVAVLVEKGGRKQRVVELRGKEESF